MYSPWYPVTPCMGVWIENLNQIFCHVSVIPSLPVWECGLKTDSGSRERRTAYVTPCMGVWIENGLLVYSVLLFVVTPCMGVWIENIVFFSHFLYLACHSLYGSVD